MKLKITKGSREFGYIIWNKKSENEVKQILKNRSTVKVIFNGFNLGEKNIDWKYHRISLGYKLTRAMPTHHNTYSININNGVLEVESLHE